jgi:hypothetical protein
MSRRCALARNDAARAAVHNGLMHGRSVHVIAKSVESHRISQSAVRRYIRRYIHELGRLEVVSAGGSDGPAYPDPASTGADPDHGSSVSSTELNAMFDLMVEGIGVVAKRDVASKEARIRANPAAQITKQKSRGVSEETVQAIRRQILGIGD